MASTTPHEHRHDEADDQSQVIRGARGDTDDASDNRSDTDTDSSVDHIADKTPKATLTKKQKIRRHCGRFWLWYLIGSIIFLAILLPIVFKVILPAIVQAIVSKQDVPVKGGGLDAISPSQVRISLNTSLDTPLPAKIDEMVLHLYNKNTTEYSPFANLTIPEQHINGNTKVNIKDQLVTVSNETELVKWFSSVFDLEEVKLSVRAKPTIRLGELHTNTHLDKTIKLPGLRKLLGFGIEDLKVMMPPDKKGNNIKGTVNIPNWGILHLNFGNISFNIFSGGVRLGLITIYDVMLPPGNNTKSFDGKLYLDSVFQNLGPVLASQSEALGRGQIDLNVTGNATTVNGQHITYIESLLNKKQLTTSMSVITLLSDVVSGFLGGGDASLVDVLGDVVGNGTFIKNVLDNWNSTTNARDGGNKPAKRSPAKDAMMWNMLKLGMRMKLKA